MALTYTRIAVGAALSLAVIFTIFYVESTSRSNAGAKWRWLTGDGEGDFGDDMELHVGPKPARGQVKRVMVTGAAGFIGSHVAAALAERGDVVVGIDNFNDYYSVSLKEERARRLKDDRGVEVRHVDVCEMGRVTAIMHEFNVTHVVHLAAQAGVRFSIAHPQEYVRNNVECFVQLFEILKSEKSAYLVYASSSSVYGLNTKIPFAERDDVNVPASLYAASKREDELIAHVYHNLYGIKSTGLRFFTVYGGWGRPDMAYWKFTESILHGEPLQVYAHGHVARDFTYIDDIVSGVLAAVDLQAELELFNLGGNHPYKVTELIDALEKELGKKAKINFTSAALGDVPLTYADLSHSAAMLGYAPKTDLATGIAKFVNWYREYKPDVHVKLRRK